VTTLFYRKGLDLKHVVADELARDYHSQLVSQIRDADYQIVSGRLTVHLAREFGFCYGVDRAVDYAYQTRRRFPDRTVYLTGEIIHNPHVNTRLRDAGIKFLSDPDETLNAVTTNDVVILPAFGVTVAELERLDRCGCTIVDTTCGSVLNVWKNVRQFARDGYTAIIHGKVHHEETRATTSQAVTVSGHYLVVLNRAEAALVCDYICGRATREAFLEHFANACSLDFDPDRDLQRVGLANQTTMLASESLEIGDMIKHAMIERHGETSLPEHYRAFETICSATQDRQDAVRALLDEHTFDLVVVVGGYNSSNTRNLARICADRVTTYHIAEPTCVVSVDELRFLPPAATAPTGTDTEIVAREWLPRSGPVSVAVTAGASTPDNIVGKVITKLVELTA